jgi:hypothetical protein
LKQSDYNKFETIENVEDAKIEFGLMDGGIVDNQAIDGFLKEAERGGKDENNYDLFISCDVSSYWVDAYTSPQIATINISWWHNLKSGIVVWILKNMIRNKFKNPKGTWAVTFSKYIDKFLSLPNHKLKLMLQTRAKSVFMLANDLYLKQIRRMYQAYLYSHSEYHNKFILNAIYDLSGANPKLTKNPLLMPSANMMAKAEKARTMSTTIWFDEEHQKQNILETIIDTGEFTMCYNLLKHYKGRVVNSEAENALVMTLENDYKAFKSK